MQQKKDKSVRKPSKATLAKQQKMKEEIYAIIQKEARDAFTFIQSRDETLQKRLTSIELAGVPEGTLEDIKRDISGLKYMMRNQTKALEGLLGFFNASKGFLNMDENDEKTKKS